MSPIVLFIYNRPDHTEQTLEALSKNTLAQESDLIVFADGPKENATQDQIEKIQQAREVVKSKQWCKTVEIRESDKNNGLAASIISGVTEIVNKYGTVIVLEDDIVTGKYFLEYMNTALEKYKNEKKVYHITGYRVPIKNVNETTSYFYPRMECWGWGTWSDRWSCFKKDAQYYKSIFTKKMIWEFNCEGSSSDCWYQVIANLNGQLNTWAIFWGASIFLKNGICLGPCKSLVKNVGLDGSGEHRERSFVKTISDSINHKVEEFPSEIKINRKEFNKNKKIYISMNKKQLKSMKNIIKIFMSKLLPLKFKLLLKRLLKRNSFQ